jgi:peptidoglycan/xylan/chitin deacetylase (PgdA/CDA1 family)
VFRFKVVISYLLYGVGLLQLWQAIAMRRKAVVLMYHRVLTDEERSRSGSHPALVVDRESFDRHMAFLKRQFRVLSIAEFTECLERKVPFPDSSCVITFDDGWRDNLTNALPILAKHGLPALVFLPVNYIGQRRLFWQEALTHLLMTALATIRADQTRRTRLRELLAPAHLDWLLELSDADPRPRVIEAVVEQKQIGRSEIEALSATLAKELGVRLEDLASTDGLIDWEDAETMARHRIAFGGHGAEHVLLTEVSPEAAECDIRASKSVLDEKLAEPAWTFSYPNGFWTREIASMVRRSGYRVAFISRRGFVTCEDDPFSIRRINVQENLALTTPMLLARILGLWGRHHPANESVLPRQTPDDTRQRATA